MINFSFKKTLAALTMSMMMSVTAYAIDVNTASQAELESIKGIGPAIASKIIAERSKGAFKSWADLDTRVKGVGAVNSQKFSVAGLTLGGQAMAGAPAVTVKNPLTKPMAAANDAVASTKASVGKVATAATAAAATKPAMPAVPAVPTAADAKQAAKDAKKAAKDAAKAEKEKAAAAVAAPVAAVTTKVADAKQAAKDAAKEAKATAKADKAAAKQAAKDAKAALKMP